MMFELRRVRVPIAILSAIAGSLGLGSSASHAEPRAPGAGADVQIPDAGPNELESRGDDVCANLIDLGLVTAKQGMVIEGDTTFADNNFTDCGVTPPCDRYDDGVSGPDQIYRFQVDTYGLWSTDTCAGAAFDTSIQLRRELGGEGCPGALCLTQDDDCCGGVCSPERLGTAHCRERSWMTLYVIVDGYSPSDFGPYTLTIKYLGTECEGDANGDGVVDPLDAGYVMSRFGCSVDTGDEGCDPADVNFDGVVDPLDTGYVLARFGDCES